MTAPASDRTRYYQEEADEGSYLSSGYNQAVLRHMLTDLWQEPIVDVCDIGSGMGSNLGTLRELFPKAQIIATDLSRSALNAGARRHRAVFPVQCDVFELPIGDSRIDLVICTEVLEHVRHLGDAVRELARIVRPGGHVLLSSPNYLNPMGLRKRFHDWQHGDSFWDPWGGHAGFERLMLPRLMSKAVERYFETLQVRGAGYLMGWIPLGYRRIGPLNDDHPFIRAGRLPILRDVAISRYLLLKKK